MIAGHGTPDQAPARLFAYREPEAMAKLLTILADHSAAYLIRQIEAGADVVQIFDSWSGVLDEATFEACCVEPVAEIVAQVRAVHPDVPIIGFPKGAGAQLRHLPPADRRNRRSASTGRCRWRRRRSLQAGGAVQGNLDPLRLVAGGKALDEGVDAILEALGDGPLVFNLGHGITPETPIAHVEAMVSRVRKGGQAMSG